MVEVLLTGLGNCDMVWMSFLHMIDEKLAALNHCKWM